jgi:hypothetical protein
MIAPFVIAAARAVDAADHHLKSHLLPVVFWPSRFSAQSFFGPVVFWPANAVRRIGPSLSLHSHTSMVTFTAQRHGYF